MVRHSIVAGRFYESDKKKLGEQIKECFLHKLGPGNLPEKHDKNILGIISPHAGYFFSGACAAHGFKELGEGKNADVYIIIGFSHSGHGACTSLDDFETPLGIIKNYAEFTQQLINNGLRENKAAHYSEHSIEVQLPFLQYMKKEARFVPVFADHNYNELAEIIKITIKEMNVKACLIASSDFTHYGMSYGYLPFTEDVKENMYKLDKAAIDLILKNNGADFINYTERTGATICGRYAIACMMRILNKKARLLKYYTSGDVLGEYDNSVGYASIVVE